MNATVTTQWARAGFGWWRRERGVLMIARTHLRAVDLAAATGSIRGEVQHDGTTIMKDLDNEAEARAWCERWAKVVVDESEKSDPQAACDRGSK